MALRLLEVYHPHLERDSMEEVLSEFELYGLWQERCSETELHTSIVVRAEDTDDVLEELGKHFTSPEQLRVIILPVEAALPRREPVEPAPEEVEEAPPRKRRPVRISVEELYEDLADAGRVTWTYVTLIALAAVVASVGILLDDVAIIIGSMVIAPLLHPNMALTLAVTLADSDLARRALLTSMVGYFVALLVGAAFGMAFEVDTGAAQVVARSDVSLLIVAVALAAGVAGALTLVEGGGGSLVGVMVAVALLPPLVAAGVLLGSENWTEAMGALLLFGINVLSIKLAGALTFLAKGVSPSAWMDKEKARRTSAAAITAWVCMLVVASVIVLLYQRYRETLG